MKRIVPSQTEIEHARELEPVALKILKDETLNRLRRKAESRIKALRDSQRLSEKDFAIRINT